MRQSTRPPSTRCHCSERIICVQMGMSRRLMASPNSFLSPMNSARCPGNTSVNCSTVKPRRASAVSPTSARILLAKARRVAGHQRQRSSMQEVAEDKGRKVESGVTNRPEVLPVEDAQGAVVVGAEVHVRKIAVLRNCVPGLQDRPIQPLDVAKQLIGPAFATQPAKDRLDVEFPVAFRKLIGAGVQPGKYVRDLGKVTFLA